MKLVGLIVGGDDKYYEAQVIIDCLKRGEAPLSLTRPYGKNVLDVEQTREAVLDWFECISVLVVDEGSAELTIEQRLVVDEVREMGIDVETRSSKTTDVSMTKFQIPDSNPMLTKQNAEAVVWIDTEEDIAYALEVLKFDGVNAFWSDKDGEYVFEHSHKSGDYSYIDKDSVIIKWTHSGWLSNSQNWAIINLGDKIRGYKTPRLSLLDL